MEPERSSVAVGVGCSFKSSFREPTRLGEGTAAEVNKISTGRAKGAWCVGVAAARARGAWSRGANPAVRTQKMSGSSDTDTSRYGARGWLAPSKKNGDDSEFSEGAGALAPPRGAGVGLT